MISRFPPIETRDFHAFMAEIQTLAAAYTPEWRASEDRGPGWGLSRVASHYLDEIAKRLNEAPHKALVAFLEMLGVSAAAPLPARTPVVFQLSPGADEEVMLERGTAVSGMGEEVVPFLTETDLAVSPARIVEALWVKRNRAYSLNGKPLDGEMETDDGNLFSFTGFLLLPEAVAEDGPAHYEIHYSGKHSGLLDPALDRLRWSYSGPEEDWRPLKALQYEDGVLTLAKDQGVMSPRAFQQRSGIWFRAQLLLEPDLRSESETLTDEDEEPVFVRGPIPAEGSRDLPVRAIVSNADFAEIAFEQGFFPFGEKPELFSGFFLCAPTVLARPELQCEIQISLLQPGIPTDDCQILWDYYDGLDWRPIPGLRDGTRRFTREGRVQFTTPADIQAQELAGGLGVWFRVRMTEGGFGEVRFTLTDKELEEEEDFHPPRVETIRISFLPRQYRPEFFAEQDMNQEMAMRPVGASGLLEPTADTAPRIYLGLDQHPGEGPTGLFLHIEPEPAVEEAPLSISYWNGDVWTPLEVDDDSRNLGESGLLRFLPPKDLKPSILAKREAYWLCASGAGIGEARQPIRALWLNGAWAIQMEEVREQTLGPSEGLPNQFFNLGEARISELEIWVDEAELLSSGQKRTLRESGAWTIDERIQDEEEKPPFRILWRRTASLARAGPGERVYQFCADTGVVRFGDGSRGEIPPVGGDIIGARFKTTLGARGNLPAGTVSSLQTTLPFLDSVVNPLAAAGGVDQEATEAAIRRGPARLSHRFRAITRGDYERLAREASPLIARARVIPGAPGRVALALLPRAQHYPEPLSFQLVKRVRSYLANFIPAGFRGLALKAPNYLRVSVHIRLALAHIEHGVVTRKAILGRLERWLHPITGRDGSGWAFGEAPVREEVADLLRGLPYHPRITVEAIVFRSVSGESPTEWRADAHEPAPKLPPDTIVFGDGKGHRIETRPP